MFIRIFACISMLFFISCSYIDPIIDPKETQINASNSLATVICDGNGSFKVKIFSSAFQNDCEDELPCLMLHERNHIKWFKKYFPNVCLGKQKGDIAEIVGDSDFVDKVIRDTECESYAISMQCLSRRIQSTNNRNMRVCLYERLESEIKLYRDFYHCNS